MEDPTPRSKARTLVLAGVATVVALVAAFGASAGIGSATAADMPSTITPTQQVQQADPTPEAPDGRGYGGWDCPERDGSGQDESAAPDSSTAPAPAPAL